jgi:hypothetical protein
MGRGVQSVAVNLEPAQFLSGWRQETGSLFLPTLSDSRVGDEVAVRIGIFGQTIRATLFGKVSVVRRVGRPSLPPGVELALDKKSLPAAKFLAMAARGEPVTFREREPRYHAVERALTMLRGKTPVAVTTINISDGGCSVVWPAEPPAVGEVMTLKLAGGLLGPSARAVVCWSTEGGAGRQSVGFRIVSQGRAGKAWKKIVAEVVASGAHTA